LAEDSASTVSLVAQNVHGGVLAVKFTPSDTLLVANGSWVVTPDLSGTFKISLHGKADANGGLSWAS